MIQFIVDSPTCRIYNPLVAHGPNMELKFGYLQVSTADQYLEALMKQEGLLQAFPSR